MSIAKEIILSHIKYRKQLLKLAKADIIKTYKGAALGWAWAIIKPAITIFVFWFAFAVGLRKGQPVNGYSFFLWLIAGMVPWFYMRDMIQGGSVALRRYTYLVTKIKFPICTIPTFVNLALFFVHIGMLCIVILIFVAAGYLPDIYYLQLPFYMILTFLFFGMWGLFASVLGAMSRDFTNLVTAMTQALFWMSGILYNANTVDVHWIRTMLLYNPVTIIVNGYRNCFIDKRWFWETPTELRNYVIVFIVMTVLALWAYRKLRKDVPDVL